MRIFILEPNVITIPDSVHKIIRNANKLTICTHNNESFLYTLLQDIFCFMIEEYVFHILPISNKIHKQFGPLNKPLILNKLIMNQCKKNMCDLDQW